MHFTEGTNNLYDNIICGYPLYSSHHFSIVIITVRNMTKNDIYFSTIQKFFNCHEKCVHFYNKSSLHWLILVLFYALLVQWSIFHLTKLALRIFSERSIAERRYSDNTFPTSAYKVIIPEVCGGGGG